MVCTECALIFTLAPACVLGQAMQVLQLQMRREVTEGSKGQSHLRSGSRRWGHARLLPSWQREVKAAVIVRLDIQVLVYRVADFQLHRTTSSQDPLLRSSG